MKRTLALLLALGLLFSLAGCVSQSDLDAVIAERDALQTTCDGLQATVDTYADLINAMKSEDYQTAMNIISEKQTAKAVAEKGDIDDYLVTVELTLDNFDDYFQWQTFYNLNDFGEEQEHSISCVLTSKVYDEGLILYAADAKLGYNFTFTHESFGSAYSETLEETRDWNDFFLPTTGCGSSPDVKFIPEQCFVEVTRVIGTVTFIKSDYVTSYELSETRNGSISDATITLINGETLLHSIHYGCKY